MGELAAGQVLAQLAFDEARQPGATRVGARRLEEGLEMLFGEPFRARAIVSAMQQATVWWPRSILVWLVLLVASASSQEAASASAKRITGRVVDENGKPIAGVAVGLLKSNQRADTARLLAEPLAVSAADGSYAITADELGGSVVLAAAGRQACAIQLLDSLVQFGGDLGETLLAPGGRLLGRVRDESGGPIAGARIRVESSIHVFSNHRVRLLAGAVSDDKGHFVVAGVPRSGLRVTVEAEGFLSESRLVAQQSSSFTLKRAGFVNGKVVDGDGAPLAGIEVYPVVVESGVDREPAVTDADGTFSMTVPKAGRFRLSGSERRPPYRQFSSGLLHGPAKDVVLSDWRAKALRELEVSVVDATSRAPITKFWLSQLGIGPDLAQLAFRQHRETRQAYEGKVRLQAPSQPGQLRSLVVDAPGHGFEIVPVPADVGESLVVALGPEAILTGRVLDAETGQPMAGVAVQALPKGTGFGSAGRVEELGPFSAGDGNYRIEGLRPGDYGVQTHARGRPASEVLPVTLDAGDANKLDVTVPKERWFEFELKGTIPAGPAGRLTYGSPAMQVFRGNPSGFNHVLPQPAPLALTSTGAFRIGPVGRGMFQLELFVPSRTRTGTGTTLQIGELDAERGPAKITLPDLTRGILRGRVALAEVPSERVAVLASPVPSQSHLTWLLNQPPNVAGVELDGSFALDLPAGAYTLQLIDILTGIVFHTESEDVRIDEDPDPVDIRPAIHWLEVECVPAQEGAEVILQALRVSLHRPRNGSCSAFLRAGSRQNGLETGGVPFRVGAAKQRWLVPAGEIEVKAFQTFEILKPWSQGANAVEVGAAKQVVGEGEHRMTLKVPAPPPDEEVLRRG